MMREVVYVTVATLGSGTAHAAYVERLITALAAQGRAVRVIGPSFREPETFPLAGTGAIFEPVWMARWSPLAVRPAARALATALHVLFGPTRPEAVYITHNDLVAAAIALRGLPLVQDLHGLGARMRISRVLSRMGGVRAVMANSHAMLDAYSRRVAPPHASLVLGSGVDPALADAWRLREEARRSLQIPAETKVLGYLGSLGRGRGIEDTLQAFAACSPATKGDCRLIFVGGDEGAAEAWRQKLAAWPAIAGKVLFVGAKLREELPFWYAMMDVLLAPYSRLIPQVDVMSPMKLLEYMSVGRSIVASDLPTVREALKGHEKWVWFFEADATADYARAIRNAIEEKGPLAGLPERAGQIIQTKNWDAKATVLGEWIDAWGNSDPTPLRGARRLGRRLNCDAHAPASSVRRP